MTDEELARLKRMTSAAGSVLGASLSLPVTTLNALIAEVERLRGELKAAQADLESTRMDLFSADADLEQFR